MEWEAMTWWLAKQKWQRKTHSVSKIRNWAWFIFSLPVPFVFLLFIHILVRKTWEGEWMRMLSWGWGKKREKSSIWYEPNAVFWCHTIAIHRCLCVEGSEKWCHLAFTGTVSVSNPRWSPLFFHFYLYFN